MLGDGEGTDFRGSRYGLFVWTCCLRPPRRDFEGAGELNIVVAERYSMFGHTSTFALLEHRVQALDMSSHLLAGATSGLISAVALQPLDLIKVNDSVQHVLHVRLRRHTDIHNLQTRLQQQPSATSVGTIVERIYRNEGGTLALWRGTAPTLLRYAMTFR